MKQIKSQPTIFVIYGATGDLCWRKLAPALYNLFLDDWMPDLFGIIGTGRTPLSKDDFANKLLEGVNKFSRTGKADENKWAEFANHIFYEAADLNNAETYVGICKCIEQMEAKWNQK